MLKVSNSSLQSFQRCRRNWMLGWYHGYQPWPNQKNPVTVTDLGTRVHAALEARDGHGLDPLKALKAAYEIAARQYLHYADELWDQYKLAEIMVSGYLDWEEQNGTDVGLEVVATEKIIEREFKVDDMTVLLVAKMDQQIRRHIDNALLFRDYKTVGTFTKANGLIRDPQMRFYAMLQWLDAKKDEEIPAGGLYTMLLRSKRTARAKGPFYQQVPISFNVNDHGSMLIRVQGVVRDMLRVMEGLTQSLSAGHLEYAYPTASDYCEWGCPFKTVCPLFDDGSRAWNAMNAHFAKGDPLGYYGTELIDQIKEELHQEGNDS